MKKAIIITITALMILALCACTDMVISIDSAEPTTSENGVIFSVIYEGSDGSAFGDMPEGYYKPGTEITAHATSVDGKAFYCWTTGDYLLNGGQVASYEKDYTFTLEEETRLYANYRNHDSALVLYHGNGGTYAPTGESYYWDEFGLDYYLYPNTLADMGNFVREGHTLVGYSTEPDGSGEFYNVGGKAFEDTDAVIELYCVWSEQSPAKDFTFTYSNRYSGWYVETYSGKDEIVSIPSEFEGEPVVGVTAGAFTGNSDITCLIFPSSMRYIENYSCNNMENLYMVFLFDSLDYIVDECFEGDYSLTTCYFGAATPPRFSTWMNNHSKKVEIMALHRDVSPKMICIGGSSTTYALDAELLQDSLDREYLVLNCGSNGANLFNMTSEWAMHFMNEGDFLLHIPEYSFWQLGGVECRWESFRSFESCYNIFSWVTVSKYTQFFTSFGEYLDARRNMAEMTYEDYTSTLAPNGYYNDHGTLNVVTRGNGSPDFWSGRSIFFCDEWLYPFMVYYTNVQYWKLSELGVDYAMAFTPLNRNSLYDYQTDEDMDAFEAYLDRYLNVDIVCDLQNYIYSFEPEIFFDDDYHLCAEGREAYTSMLADDLNAYFASEKGESSGDEYYYLDEDGELVLAE